MSVNLSRKYGEVVDPETGELFGRLDERGREVPYGGPVALAVDLVRHDTLHEMIRRIVHSETMKLASMQAGIDTPEEADDFDIEDDPLDPLTPYEEHFMPKDAPIPERLKEKSDGGSKSDEGRVDAGGRGSGAGGEVRQGESDAKSSPADSGSVRKAAGGDPPADK